MDCILNLKTGSFDPTFFPCRNIPPPEGYVFEGGRHSPFQVLDASAIEGIRGLAGESSSIYSCIQNIRRGEGSEGGFGGGPPPPRAPLWSPPKAGQNFGAQILLAPKAPKQKFGCQPQTLEGEGGGDPPPPAVYSRSNTSLPPSPPLVRVHQLRQSRCQEIEEGVTSYARCILACFRVEKGCGVTHKRCHEQRRLFTGTPRVRLGGGRVALPRGNWQAAGVWQGA